MATEILSTKVENEVNYQTLSGRRKILLDVFYNDFISNPTKYIKENLGNVIMQHQENVAEFEYLEKFKKGYQDIYKKLKANGNNINNMSVTNYAWEIVKFKVGYYVGKPITYVNNNENTQEELVYFNKYLDDVSKSSKDIKKYNTLLTTGLAYTFVRPNPKKYNSENESPYTYDVLDNKSVCMVYSNDISHTVLFSVYFTTRKIENKTYNSYICYANGYSYEFVDKKNGDEKYTIYEKKEPMDQPITEYELNPERMCCFEPIISSLNTCNVVRSNQLDDIEEFVNALIVFLNQNPDFIKNNLDQIKESRMIGLKTNNPATPADIKVVANSLDHNSINNLYSNVKQDAFDIIGVPMATSSTGQGVSGESQQYGSGWENAQNIANVDTTYVKQFEKEDMKKFIEVCKEGTNNKLKTITQSDIIVKYTISKSNDIMNKSQSFKYLVDLGIPYDKALEMTQLHDDSYSLGNQANENYFDRIRKENDLTIEKEVELYRKKKELDKEYADVETNANKNQEQTNQNINLE